MVHRLRTNNVNVYVSKLYPSGLIFGGAYVRDVNWVTYLGGVYLGGLIYGRRINGILRYDECFTLMKYLFTNIQKHQGLLKGSLRLKTNTNFTGK